MARNVCKHETLFHAKAFLRPLVFCKSVKVFFLIVKRRHELDIIFLCVRPIKGCREADHRDGQPVDKRWSFSGPEYTQLKTKQERREG